MGNSDRIRNLAFLALRCLCEYANLRLSIFDDKATKNAYVANFVQNLIETIGNLGSQDALSKLNCIMANNRLFREMMKLIHKFQFNFGVRGVSQTDIEGLTEKYFETLYTLTISGLRSSLPNKKQTITELMSYMNHIW
jgi:hypothetical protein